PNHTAIRSCSIELSTLLSPPQGLDVCQVVFIVVYVRYTPGSRQWVHRQLAVASLRHHSVSNGATRIHKAIDSIVDYFAESRKQSSADGSIHVDSEVRLQLAVVCESFTHKRRASPSLGSLTIDRVQQSSHGGGPAAVEQIDLIDPIPNCAISTNRIRNHVVVRQVVRRRNVSATTENRPTKRVN